MRIEQGIQLETLIKYLVALLLLLLIFGYWVYRMRREISVRKRAEKALQESENYLKTIINTEPECIKVVSAEGLLLQMNPAGLAMIEAEGFEQIAKLRVLDVIAPEYRNAFVKMHNRVIAGEAMMLEFEVIGLKGGHRWLKTHAVPMQEVDGTIVHLAVTRDITERKAIETKLRMLSTAIEQGPTSVVIVNLDAEIEYVNSRFSEVTGYSPAEVIGNNPRVLQSGLTQKLVYSAMWDSLTKGQPWVGEFSNKRKNGEIYYEEAHISPVKDERDVISHYVAVKLDITERKKMEEQIRQLAFYDELTMLPNRRLMNDRLSQAISTSNRSHKHGALMFLDMDNFKPLNDMYGHGVGDLLLIDVAHRLEKCIREMDTVARFGGDEFVVMLTELAEDKQESVSQASTVAEKIRETLSEPYLLTSSNDDKTTFTVEHDCTVSIGVTVFVGHETGQDEILIQADVSMYQAKDAGRNQIRFHHKTMGTH